MLPSGAVPYYRMPFEREVYANGVYLPKRSQKIKNKRLRKKDRRNGR